VRCYALQECREGVKPRVRNEGWASAALLDRLGRRFEQFSVRRA
jgi:hypothetical protein